MPYPVPEVAAPFARLTRLLGRRRSRARRFFGVLASLLALAAWGGEPARTGDSASVQDLAARLPGDWAPGPAVISGQVMHRAIDGAWLNLKTQSRAGTFIYHITRCGAETGAMGGSAGAPVLPPGGIASRGIRWDAIKPDGETDPHLRLEGELTEISKPGSEATGRFAFLGETVLLNFLLIESYPLSLDPPPTYRDVAYGANERQVMDVYLAKTKTGAPAPAVVYIHGGSWLGRDKTTILGQHMFLDQGISVIAINYRYAPKENPSESVPAVALPLHDAARALQFIRSKAAEWGLDKDRIALWGRSAGACTGLWLATHPDMREPSSADPIARESTRPSCVAAILPQTSLDPVQMREWVGPELEYGPHAFAIKAGPGETRFEAFLAARERLKPWIAEYSPAALVDRHSAPIFIDCPYYSLTPCLPLNAYYTHSPKFGLGFLQLARSVGAECYLRYEGREDSTYRDWTQFLIVRLTGKQP